MNFPILSLVTFLPLAGAVLFIFIHRSKENLLRLIKDYALIFLLGAILLIGCLIIF